MMIDDLGYNDVSYHNTSDLSSPNIDALAQGGVRLERYYTHNLCSPSRTAFLSGRYAYNIGMQGCVIINGQAVDLPKGVRTVADRLSDGGFSTAAFGKWDAGMTTWDYTPMCRGFDYFYGFLGPAQDHFTHSTGGGLDLRENFTPDKDQQGVYSTHLYTQKAQAWIRKTVGEGAQKTFMYLAYQAMHGPVQAPQEYIDRCSHVTTENNRRKYCGMMMALDEGIGNLTSTYQDLGIWEDTLLLLAADNGGHIGSSGNNWPLRGEKSSNYEGGVRGVSFIHWSGFSPAVKGTVSEHVVHVADWLPTLVAGAAGLALEDDDHKWPVDGLDQWAALTSPGSVALRGEDTEVLHEIGGDNHIPQESIVVGRYKLIRYIPVIYHAHQYFCEDSECPTGWMPLPGHGHPTPPPASENNTNGTAALVTGGTWLFDVQDDPLEQHELSAQMPDIVKKLADRLDVWKQRGIEQRICPKDPLSDPKKYFDGVWTPWRGSPEPRCNAGGSNEECRQSPVQEPESNLDGVTIGSTCKASGWCSGPSFSGPPLSVQVIVDGVSVANGTASLHRPTAGDHGFQVGLDCDLLKAGSHSISVQCLYDQSRQWFELKKSPVCVRNGAVKPCAEDEDKIISV